MACLLPRCLIPRHFVRRVSHQAARYQTDRPAHPLPTAQRSADSKRSLFRDWRYAHPKPIGMHSPQLPPASTRQLTCPNQTRSGREYSSLCALLGATPVFCADGVGIEALLGHATERDVEAALDNETDDEHMGDPEAAPDNETDDQHMGNSFESRDAPGPSSITEPRPLGGCSSTTPSAQRSSPGITEPRPLGDCSSTVPSVQSSCAPASGPKRARTPSPPSPQPKKSKHARKHKKTRYARAEKREREGHIPRPKVIKRSVEAGSRINTALDTDKTPVAHGAYVAKNSSEPCASKKYSPTDLDSMGFVEVPWNGL